MNYNRRDSFVDKYEKIVDLSIKEIEHIRSKYNWHVNLAATIVVIVIASGYWLLSDHINGYKQILDNKFNEILSSTESKQNIMNERFVKETNKNIKDLVSKNFSEKEILKTINIVASEKVDSFSNQYLNKLIEEKITPKLNSVSMKLSDSESKIQLIDFYLSKVAAYNDDRVSFDKLIDISKDKKNKYHDYAEQIINSLISKYAQKSVPRKHFILISTESDEDFTWSYNDCKNWIFNYPKDDRMVILENVFEIKRFSGKEKTELALLVVKQDESLTVVRKASDFLIDKFKLPYRSLEINKILDAMRNKGYM